MIFYDHDYYMGGIEDNPSFCFMSDSDTVYFAEDEEIFTGTYYIDEEEKEVTVEIDGESMLMFIHTPADLYDPETGEQYALPGTYNWEVVTGYTYWLNADEDSGFLSFQDDGSMTFADPKQLETIEGTYTVDSDNYIYVEYDGGEMEIDIVNNYVLVHESSVYIRRP